MTAEPPAIPDIELVRPVGRGRFGTTYLGRVTRDHSGLKAGDAVAVKVLSPEASRDPRARRRFEEEGRLMARVSGPGLVQLLSAGAVRPDDTERLYLVLEYVDGETLREHLERVGALPEDRVVRIGEQLSRALAELHASGVVHRDVKPENVLVTPRGQIKLADLGLAGASGEPGSPGFAGSPATGLVGSLGYAAPEQFDKGEASPRSDLYSLGVVLYELATGEHPFSGEDTPGAWVQRQLQEAAPLPSTRCTTLSVFFDRLVAALLERDPALRPASAIEVADILDHREASDWFRALDDPRPRSQHLRRAARDRIHVARDTPFVSRDAELAELRDLLRHGREGKGSVGVLRGEAGVGKTRLLDRFVSDLGRDPEPAFVLYARCQEESTTRPYEPLRRVFETYYSLSVASNRRRADQWARHVAGLLPGPQAGLQAVAEILFGVTSSEDDESGAEIGEEAVGHVLTEALLAIAHEIPLILIIDNLEWIDRPSLRALDRLVQRVGEAPLLLLAAARDDAIEPEQLVPVDVLVRRGARVIGIPRLDEAGLESLLASRYHSREVARRLVQSVSDRTSGNPDFVVRLLDVFEDEGIVARETDGRWVVLQDPEHLIIPPTVTGLLVRQITKLPRELAEVLAAASVQGVEFELEGVAIVLDKSSAEIQEALTHLDQRRLVRSRRNGFRFDRGPVRDLLYRSLGPARRRDLHRRLAQYYLNRQPASSRPGIVSLLIGRHGLEGDLIDETIREAINGARYLQRTHAPLDALRLVDRALERLGAEPEGPHLQRAALDLMFLRADLTEILGERSGQADNLRRAARLAQRLQDRRALSAVYRRLARFAILTGAYLAANSYLERALSYAREVADPSAEASTVYLLGINHSYLGDYETGRRHFESALAAWQEREDLRGEAQCLDALGRYYDHKGDPGVARDHFNRAVRRFGRAGDEAGEAEALFHRARLFASTGEDERAREDLERARQLSIAVGDRRTEAMSAALDAEIRRRHGKFENVRPLLEDAIDILSRQDDRRQLVRALIFLARLLGDDRFPEKDLERALSFSRQAMRQADDTGIPPVRIQSRATHTHLLLEAGRHAEAAECARELIALLKRHSEEIQERPIFYRIIAQALTAKGDPVSADQWRRRGERLLQARAARLPSPEARQRFIASVEHWPR